MRLVSVITLAGFDYLFTVKLVGKTGSISARAEWLPRQARRFMWALEMSATYCGEFPAEGVLVGNHVSYLDIIVLAARHPLVFISKAEVAHWPVFGALTQFAGTLFIRRDLRADVARIGNEMPKILKAGVVLAFFPEGTSTGGDRVLPFRASLLGPLAQNRWPVTPAFLRYELEPGDGSVADEVAYWRDMSFGPHLLNLLGKRRIHANLTYGVPQVAAEDRKALAVHLHGEVCRLGGLTTDGVEVAATKAL